MIKGAEMIVGTLKNTYAFSILPEQSVDDYKNEIELFLKNAPKGSILIADLFGGTTSNVAAALSKRYDVLAVSGLDMAMLIAADELREEYEGNELIEKLIEKSKENCKNIGKMLREAGQSQKDKDKE